MRNLMICLLAILISSCTVIKIYTTDTVDEIQIPTSTKVIKRNTQHTYLDLQGNILIKDTISGKLFNVAGEPIE